MVGRIRTRRVDCEPFVMLPQPDSEYDSCLLQHPSVTSTWEKTARQEQGSYSAC